MRSKYPAGLLSGIALTFMAGAVQAESPNHARFEHQVRDHVVAGIAGNRFASACFMAENGLHAQVNLQFDRDESLTLTTQYYLDDACSEKVDMLATHSGYLVAFDRDINRFTLSDHPGIVLDRDGSTLVFTRGTEVVRLSVIRKGEA